MTSTSTPPPSSLERAVELDAVRDVMLLEGSERMVGEPIPRYEGAPAPLARLEAQLRRSRATEDFDAERTLSLELSRVHFERRLDVDLAVQLLHRALDIEDDRELRRELAERLGAMGRHVEAGHVLRDGEPATKEEVFSSWIASGDSYARAGDADEAVATFREAAMVLPDSPIPFARIAEIAYWAPDVVPPERAADAWIEAGKRYVLGSDPHVLCVIRAVEVAPAYARSTEAYTKLLERTGRAREATEIWRAYGVASGHVAEVARRRARLALEREDYAVALGCAFDACIVRAEHDAGDGTLDEMLARDAVAAWLAAAATGPAIVHGELVSAAREKTSAARAEALIGLGSRLRGEAQAVLLSLASEAFAAAADPDRACETATVACAAAPWLPRAQAALMALGGDPRLGLGDIEDAIGRLPARSSYFRLAAERFSAVGAHHLALIHCRRLGALRPGDLLPLEELLRRAIASGQPDSVAEAVAFVLQSARPWKELSSAIAAALRAIEREDAQLALRVVEHVLATIGPGDDELCDTLRRIAAATEDAVTELAIVLGRAVSDQIDDADRAGVYLQAAAASLAHGDTLAAAIHVSRAAAHSGELERIMDAIERVHGLLGDLDPREQSDANMALARATAWAAEQQDARAAVDAWRHLGALRWDLADDAIGADEAFFVACAIDPDNGPYRYALDLRDRAGPDDAFPIIVERAVNVEHEGADARLYAKLYAAAARVAADAGKRELAIDAAVAAVRADPSRGDAVAIVEKIADGESGLSALNFVYDTLADAALGRYGFRAAHYRAARQLEKLRAYDDALRHAIQAFEAVPSVGASYRMLLRLSERSGNEEAAVATLASVAAAFPLERQVTWLVRAADLARKTRGGGELRLELLLKAFALRHAAELVHMLADAAQETLSIAEPAAADVVRDRLERATRTALPKLKHPQAAPVAVALAVLAARDLKNGELAVEAFVRAIELDGHETDVSPLIEQLPIMAENVELARKLLDTVNNLRTDSDKQLSPSLKEVTSKLYLELSDVTPPPLSPVPPAMEEDAGPDSDQIITTRPPEDSVSDGRVPDADEALLAHRFDSLVEKDDAQLFDEHFDALDSGKGNGRSAAAEDEQAAIPTNRPPADVPQPPDPFEAFRRRKEADVPPAPPSSDVMILSTEDIVAYTEPPSEEAVDALEAAASVAAAAVSDPGTSSPGHSSQPPAHPGDTPGPGALADDFSVESEARARERGDHAAIAEMLAARARATDNLEQRRLIRLRRAAVLEQRLDRIDEACTELERILDESGDDPTALRYLADLRDRQGRHARAAKLWLRASQQATHLDEKIRDVARCCESLIAAGRPETAKKLIDAARGLPQSPRLLKLRVTIARKVDDPVELREALAELEALSAQRITHSSPPSREGLAALDARPGHRSDAPGPDTEPQSRRPSRPPDEGTRAALGDRSTQSRRVYRVTSAPPPENGDADRDASDTLDACRRQFLEHGPGSAREAKRSIRRLRSIVNEIDDADRDLYTYLLVECFDAAQGTGAATHALQQHWEAYGGTPLVTAAVADRLVRRNEVRPALQLYARILDKDLLGLRDNAELALSAADLAHEEGEELQAARFLQHALNADHTRAHARDRHTAWFPGIGEEEELGEADADDIVASSVAHLGDASRAHEREPSRTPTNHPPPKGPDEEEDTNPRAKRPTDTDSLLALAAQSAAAEAEESPSPAPADTIPLEDLALTDDGSAVMAITGFDDAAPPPLATPQEDALVAQLAAGSLAAGDQLVSLYMREDRLNAVVEVRRRQAIMRRGDREVLAALRDAALAVGADHEAQAAEHVLYSFDADRAPADPPALHLLAARPEATTRLLFGPLEGTINEALGIVCTSGMMRRELSDYDFTGTDRVPPVATTPVGRVYAALTRLLDLESTRLFHRSRAEGRLEGHVALLAPLSAILSGTADRETPTLRYVLGSALAAATPPLALVEGLSQADARNLIQALLAGFGPVDEGSLAESSQEQMRMAEDLWHMVPSSADRRLRELCDDRRAMSYETAVESARRTRRRVGLFSCGDLVTAVVQVVHELDLPMPRPIRGVHALRELCQKPAIADLYDLALSPGYAEARWRTT